MGKINQNYLDLQESYLFSTIANKVNEFKKQYPEKKLISLGIGDVTLPLCHTVIDALHQGTNDMAEKSSFKGYGPEQGYEFLREAVARYYHQREITIEVDEIFISDGAKSDLGNILDLFSTENKVLIPNPVYPVYVDTNIMDHREIIYMDANIENGFLPEPDDTVHADIIYLCSPNNPTGAVYNRDQLAQWVSYALKHNSVILFDSAYEAFIQDKEFPRSIFEIDGAKQCAIEFCSLSKTAGFTGLRCGYTVVPKELMQDDVSLNKLWLRRQTTKFNGVPYIVQRAASAVFSLEGQKEIQANLDYYRENAKIIAEGLEEIGIWFTGGEHSPYIWLKCPNGMSSWEFFDLLLNEAYIVGTPGSGFGSNGEGFFRLTAFGNHGDTKLAVERMKSLFCNG